MGKAGRGGEGGGGEKKSQDFLETRDRDKRLICRLRELL